MAFTLVQSGTSLQMLDTSGNIATLTLPTNITLSASRVPRFAVIGKYVVVVNSPSRPVTVDVNGIVRVLSPRPPASQITLSAVAGGTLTGTYTAKQTFRIKDSLGNIIAESDFGPIAAAGSVAAQYLKAAGLDLSPDDVSSSMVYRTTTGGATYFPWIELDGNTQTSIQDDLSDAGINLVAAPTLGTAPDLTLVTEYKSRLWGVDRTDNDNLRYANAGRMFAWPTSQSIPIPKLGTDRYGITALGTSRDALLVGRYNILHQVTGKDSTNFSPVKISENCGVVSQESVAVFNNTFYFLWQDGVYQWDSNGLKCISDGDSGKGRVRSWFVTDSYFNRAKFSIAKAIIDPVEKKYKLFLCSAGSSVLDRWVEFDLFYKTWWGPHKTGAFTPSCAFMRSDANDIISPVIGSTLGYLWKEQSTKTDDTATAIDFDVNTKRHDGQTPDIDKVWGQLSLFGVAQTTGNMTVTPYVGELNAPASATTLNFDLTKNRQVIGRPGVGKHLKLNFRENTVGQDLTLTGYEQEFSELGKR